MAKTNEQVKRYLADCEFSEQAWEKVLQFCRKNGLDRAHKSSRPKSRSSYAKFLDWYRNGYGAGDVVSYRETYGILSTCTPEYSEFCAYYTLEGRLIVDQLRIDTGMIKGRAYEMEKRIYEDLQLSGYEFDANLSRIKKISYPRTNLRVEYESGYHLGYGVVGRYDGGYVRFLFAVEDGVLKMYHSVPLRGIKFSAISRDGINIINDALGSKMLKWDQEKEVLVKMRPRSEVGRPYWYVSDRFSVLTAKDGRTPTDNVRYNNGNYFTDRENALSFLAKIVWMRDGDCDELL